MHDRLFANQKELTKDRFMKDAVALGLDTVGFQACLTKPTSSIEKDLSIGQVLAVTGTPTFFVGTIQADGRVLIRKRLSGAQPTQQFRQAFAETERTIRN